MRYLVADYSGEEAESHAYLLEAEGPLEAARKTLRDIGVQTRLVAIPYSGEFGSSGFNAWEVYVSASTTRWDAFKLIVAQVG